MRLKFFVGMIYLVMLGEFCLGGQKLGITCPTALTTNSAGRPSPAIEHFLRNNPRLTNSFIQDIVKNRLLFGGGAFKTAFKETMTAHTIIGEKVEKSDEMLVALSKGSSLEMVHRVSSEILNRVLVLYELRSNPAAISSNDLKTELGFVINDSERTKNIAQEPDAYNKTKSLLKEIIDAENGEEFLTQAIAFALPTYIDEYRTWTTNNTGRGFLTLITAAASGSAGLIGSVAMAAGYAEFSFLLTMVSGFMGVGAGVVAPVSVGMMVSNAKISKQAKQLESVVSDYYKWNPIAVLPGGNPEQLGLDSTFTSIYQTSDLKALLTQATHVQDRETVPDAIQRASIEQFNTEVEKIKDVSDVIRIGIQIDGAIDVLSRDLITDRIIQAQGLNKIIPLIDLALKQNGTTLHQSLKELANFRNVDLFEILKNLERFHSDSTTLIMKIDQLIENIIENLDTYDEKQKIYSDLIVTALEKKITYLKQTRSLLKDLIAIEGKIHELVLKEEALIMNIKQNGLRLKILNSNATETESINESYKELKTTTQTWISLLKSLNDPNIGAMIKTDW